MPGRHPFEELEAVLGRVADTAGIDLGAAETGLLRAALRVLPDEGRELVLVIDQFEELFTLVDERTRRSFLNSLVTAVDSPHSRVRVIVTLRADFYDRPLVYPTFAPLFVAGAVTVTPLEAAELEAVVREPAARVGTSVESSLLAQIVSDMAEHPGALPLLQFTLTELFDSRSGSELTVAEYQQIGGLRGTLSRRAEGMLSAMTDSEQELARQLFLRLVRVDKGGQSTRRRVPLAELRSLGSDNGSGEEIIARLGAERLLVFDRDLATGGATVEVTHEAILTGWTRLRDWIDEHRSDLQRREALGTAAADWEAAARHEDYLLSGTRLASFESWRQETTLQLAGHEAAYLQASSDHRHALALEESRRRRRARRLRVGQLAAVGSFAAALAFFAPTTINSVLNPPPDVVFVIDEPSTATVGLGKMGLSSFEQALVEFDVDGAIRVWGGSSRESMEDVHADLARQGVDLVINFLGGSFEPVFAVDHPETRFVIFDSPVELPNVTSLVFAEHEGSFLVGAAAALTSETGVIGFIGGVDIPVIWRFQMGFEAGARHVRPDIEVRIDYLGDYFENSGFGAPSHAARVAESMYRDGVDVIFTVAGDSGHGTLDAAERLSAELGRHLWAIGVDVDEYHTSQQLLELDWPAGAPPWNVAAWPPHILTSMLKRYDNAVAGIVEDYAHGRLEAGVRELGLAEQGVGYATSGGHISDLVPVLDELERRVVSGEIVVPSCPPGREEGCEAAAFRG
jgi:basic membrane lipoprotein Med (substrate-binding protein (PBP1-ABC) superfamily)